jgi:hypothetical protein
MEPVHLEPSARDALALPAEQRIEYLQRPRWIGYSRAREIVGRLEEVLRHPKVHRMPNILLLGESNNGKTMLAARFAQRHRTTSDPSKIRVLMVQTPAAPDENRFYAGILEALNAPYRPQETAARRQIQILHLLRSIGLEIVHPGCSDLAALDWAADGELLALLATQTDVPLPAVESLRLRFHPELGLHDLLHHNWQGPALQYCPACLAEGAPYYRRSWRLACFRVCPQHHTAMRDQCPHCGSIIRLLELPPATLALCQNCGHPLMTSECMPLSRSECLETLIDIERRMSRLLV